MKPINRLSIGLAMGLCFVVRASMAQPNEMASFRKLFRQPDGISSAAASDRLKDCTPLVRRAIKRVQRKYGEFHFSCINGVVRNIFVAPTSLINSEPAAFIEGNLGLFDLQGSSVAVRFDGDTGIQLYQGLPVPGSVLFRVKRQGQMLEQSQEVGSISTRDLKHAPGMTEGRYVVFELGLTDPDDEDLNPSHGVKVHSIP